MYSQVFLLAVLSQGIHRRITIDTNEVAYKQAYILCGIPSL